MVKKMVLQLYYFDCRYTDMVAVLVRNNVNIYETGSGHMNATHLAARMGYVGILSLLLSHGSRYDLLLCNTHLLLNITDQALV